MLTQSAIIRQTFNIRYDCHTREVYMAQGKTEQQRVYIEDAEEMKRLAGLLTFERGAEHSFGDVVRLAKLALYQQRPDLARMVQRQQAQP